MAITNLRQLERTLETIEAELEKLQKSAEHFRGVIAYLKEHESELHQNISPGDDLKDSIERLLDIKKTPLHPEDIYKMLQEQGIHVAGRNPVHNTRSHMSGDKAKRFFPAGDGKWGLRKWLQMGRDMVGDAISDYLRSDTSMPTPTRVPDPPTRPVTRLEEPAPTRPPNPSIRPVTRLEEPAPTRAPNPSIRPVTRLEEPAPTRAPNPPTRPVPRLEEPAPTGPPNPSIRPVTRLEEPAPTRAPNPPTRPVPRLEEPKMPMSPLRKFPPYAKNS